MDGATHAANTIDDGFAMHATGASDGNAFTNDADTSEPHYAAASTESHATFALCEHPGGDAV